MFRRNRFLKWVAALLPILVLTCAGLAGVPPAHAATMTYTSSQAFAVSGQNISASADVPFNGQVANVSDPSATSASQLSVSIDWGDGSLPSSGIVSGTGPSFSVSGSHTYNIIDPFSQNQFPLSYTITFSVTDTTTGQVGNGSGTATLNAELHLNGYGGLSPTVGVPYSTTVADFYDPKAPDPGQFSATINWGDGSPPSAGTMSNSPYDARYLFVSGTHTYATPGPFITTITVTNTTTGQSGFTSGSASTDLSLDLQTNEFPLTATQNVPFSGQVVAIYDQGAIDPGQLSATIDWGDGTSTSAATISRSADSDFISISDTHTYATAGVFSATISVIDTVTGQSGIGSAVFDVGEFSVSGRYLTATAGTQFSGQVATFNYNYSNTSCNCPGQLSASIDWGDGSSPSAATISGSGPVYTVSGSHTYSKPGSYTITISVTDTTTNQTGKGTGTATVTSSPVQVSGQNITATQSVQFSGQLATVSDAAASGSGQLTATIDWGDGSSTSQGTVSGTGSSFTVSGSHTYVKAGSDTITITVTDTTTNQTGKGTGTATVTAPPAVNVTSQNITATSGVQFSGQVATVSDAAASGSGQLTATIDWGDGSSSTAGAVSGANGTFTISGSHTYAKAGSFSITVTVTDTTTNQIGKGTSTASVNSPLSVSGQNVTTTAGVQFSGMVATVTGVAQPSDLTATINWGDGSSTSQGTVSGTGSSFSVSGSHTYAKAGSFPISISIKDTANGQTATATAMATVATALSLKVTGQSVSASEGSSFSGGVATGTETGITGTLSASISWGDGSTSTGTMTSTGNGAFKVSGAHTYAEEGSYTTSITVSDGNGHSATGTGSAAVVDAALQVTKIAAVPAGNGAALAALFTDADSQGTVSDYKATINWGDGTSSSATIVKNPQGPGFAVAGTHRYTHHGKFTLTLTITDAGGSSVTATQTITV